ncbi:MAG: permease-like cell division protein FtsX [Desulfitobacterium hafniense]|nr:permease-like cell division protein FtsX [Desulfitobacterium hafniense]
MIVNSLEYIARETLFSMRRNIWLSLASIVTVMVSLVILGASALFLVNASHMAKDFESQLEIAVFIKTEAAPQQVQTLEGQIRAMSEVASIELTTKEQALNEFGKSIGSNGILSDLGGVNPFPDKFTVQAVDPQQVKSVAEQLAVLPGVETVRYGQGVVDKLLKFTAWLRWIGLGVILAFSVASIVLISLNIKINVFSRRREIQIMKLVGASNSFIRWPFMVEGLLLGLIGGLLAVTMVGFGYQWLIGYVQSTLAFLPVVTDPQLVLRILGGLLATGMGIGALGSVISLGRFLKV